MKRILLGVLVCLVALPSFHATAKAPQRSARAPRTAVVHHPDGHPVDRARPIELRASYVDHRAGEPTLGVSHAGNVFLAAAEAISFGGSVPRVDVLRSNHVGAAWEVVSPNLGGVNLHASTGDPYVFVDDHGQGSRVFTVDLQAYVCSLLSFSDDEGETWTSNPFGCGRPYGDHQTLFSAPPVSSPTVGYPNVIYYCFQDVVSSSCTKSLDGGIAFAPAGTISYPGFDETTGAFCGGLHGHGFGAEDGSIYVPKVHCERPWIAFSRDEGATWERVQVDDMPAAGHEASVAADAKGNVYYTFIGRNLMPYLAVSRNRGKTWGEPMMVAPPGVGATSLPSLDVSDDGHVVVAYMGSENPDPRHPVTQTWNGYLTSVPDPLARRPLLYSAQTNLDADPMLRGDCAQVKCGPVYDFIDVVIDSTGTAWGAFVDGCTQLCARTPTPNDDGAGLVVRWEL